MLSEYGTELYNSHKNRILNPDNRKYYDRSFEAAFDYFRDVAMLHDHEEDVELTMQEAIQAMTRFASKERDMDTAVVTDPEERETIWMYYDYILHFLSGV